VRPIAHLVRADLRHSWLPLAAWLVLAVIVALIPCVVPTLAGGDSLLLSSLELPIALVTIAYPLALLVLVVHVVQTHPVVGSSAFWMTRPISPRTLLASKLVFVGVAAVTVPMIIEIVRMIAHGVPWRTQLGVALNAAMSHAFLVALIMLGAAVTATMSRFLLLVGAVLVSLAVVITVLIVIGSRSAPAPSYVGWSNIPDPTPIIVQSVLFVLGIGGALLAQYVMRSRVRTVVVAAVGIAASILASMFWPWPMLRPAEVAPSWTHNDAALLVSVDASSASGAFSSVGLDRQKWIGVRGPLRVEGIDPQFSARVGVAEASLRVGGETLTSQRELYPITLDSSGEVLSQPRIVPRAVLGVDRVAAWIAPQRELPTLFFADAAAVQRHAPGSGQYQGRVRVVLQRHDVEAVMPLVVGQVHHRRALRVVIDHIDRLASGFALHVHESWAGSAFERALHPLYSYYLRNPRIQEAVPGSAQPLAAAINALRFLSFHASVQDSIHGFVAREQLVYFAVPSGPGGQGIVLDEAWLADAELVIVSTTRAGTVQRDLTIADFPLSLPTRADF